jgi:hypothetical protein
MNRKATSETRRNANAANHGSSGVPFIRANSGGYCLPTWSDCGSKIAPFLHQNRNFRKSLVGLQALAENSRAFGALLQHHNPLY